MNELSHKWVVDGVLARSCRPGYPGKDVDPGLVANIVEGWLRDGVKSVICLLDESQLAYCKRIPEGLLGYYRMNGFQISHIPATDYKYPPLSDGELKRVQQSFEALPNPVLIHCSAGIDRTGASVRFLVESKACLCMMLV